MANASQLEWGLKDSSISGPALWGARCYVEDQRTREQAMASYQLHKLRLRNGEDLTRKRMLVVLHDRQHLIGDDHDIRVALKNALNGGALDDYRQLVSDGMVGGGGEAEVTYQHVFRGVRFYTRPRGGYLYITATWEGH